jgi:Zn-dependent protease/predicted transcriptional regulator
MDRHTIPLGRIFGIPICLDYSWFLIFALLTWTMAVGYYPAEFINWPVTKYWMMGAITAIMLFVSVLLHELGHSLVARHYHLPVRNITLFIFGGVSIIGSEPPCALAGFWISIAGPLTSFALGAIFSLVQPFFTDVPALLVLLKYLVYINVGLGLFNLIPGFPLDGGGIFRAIAWGVTGSMRKATLIASYLGRFIASLLILFGVWHMLMGNLLNGMWIAFIGWFLKSAATGQVQQQALRDVLAGHKVAQAMSQQYATIPADTTLQQLVDHHILDLGQRSLLVKSGDQVIGLLTVHLLKGVPRSQWSTTMAAQIVIPITEMKKVRCDTDLWEALEEMDRDGVNQLPVMADGHVQGMLRREDVVTYLRTLQELRV